VLLHDVETGDVVEIGTREWVLLAGADGTRDLDGILLAASREGVRADKDALAALLEGVRGAGMLAEGPAPRKSHEGPAALGNGAAKESAARNEIERNARPIERLAGYSFHCDGHGSCCQLYATIVFSPLEAARARALRPEVLDGGDRHDHAFTPERGAGPCAGSAVALVNGRCAYLEGSLCSLHSAGGAASKPLGCNLFPLALVDDGTRVRASVAVECACVLASAGKPGGAPILDEKLRFRGDLDPAIVVDELPDTVAVDEERSVPVEDYVRWSDAVASAIEGCADVATAAWALGDALGKHGFDVERSLEAIALAPPFDADLALRYIEALGAKAAQRAKAQSVWRSPRDLCRRAVAIVAASATILGDSDVLAAVATGAGAAPADEAFYLRATLFGHQMVGYPIATALRDRAVAMWIARVFPLAADTLHPGETEPAFAHPLALVEALLRGHGLRRYTEEVAATAGRPRPA